MPHTHHDSLISHLLLLGHFMWSLISPHIYIIIFNIPISYFLREITTTVFLTYFYKKNEDYDFSPLVGLNFFMSCSICIIKYGVLWDKMRNLVRSAPTLIINRYSEAFILSCGKLNFSCTFFSHYFFHRHIHSVLVCIHGLWEK